MYGCENWTIKKAKCQRTDAFELWGWRRLMRVSWTARSNQSILREINPEYLLEGLMLQLKFQYFGHLMRTADSLEKSLILGKIEGRRRRGIRGWDGWMASLMQWTWTWTNFGRWWGTERPDVLQFMGLQRIGHDWMTEQQKHHLGSSKNHFLMEVLLCVSVLIQMVCELKAGRRRCDTFHQRLYNKLLEKWQLAFLLPEHSNPLQYFCLENLMDRGAWWATVHRVTQGQT